MRLVSVREKTIAVVVLLAVDGLLMVVLNPLVWTAGSIILSLLQLAGWYLATRVFRGAGEPVGPARVWWRMTARPLLSGVWSALYLIGFVASLVALPMIEVTGGDLVSLLVQAVLAYLFGLSFVRLRRLQAAQAPAAPAAAHQPVPTPPTDARSGAR